MTFSLTWLPGVLRSAGLTVIESDGWETRGHGDMANVSGVLCHHTGTPGKSSGNMPALNILINGRPDLPGPLSQLGLGRDGTYYIIAAGRCYHAGEGKWQGITAGNSRFIGIEAENTGGKDDKPWPEIQMDAYHRGVAAILKHIGKGPEFCAGHKEYALPKGRKSDPSFDMVAFREAVALILGPPVTGPRPTLKRGLPNDPELVKIMQEKIGVNPDGNFGPKTEAAIKAFQATNGLLPDGVVGRKTWELIDMA